MRNVMHLLISGNYGGIESLARDYAIHSVHNNFFVFVLAGGPVADQMSQNGAKVIMLGGSSRKLISTYMAVKAVYKENDIDTVVIQHDSPLLHFLGLWLKRDFHNAKFVDYIHRDPVDYLHDGGIVACVRNAAIIKMFQASDKVIAISEFTRKRAVDCFHLPTDKIEVVYNGVDFKKFSNDNETIDTRKLIYVGRLEEKKGVQTILEAVKLILANEDVHLTIVGDGGYREKLESLANKLGVSDNVSFVGMQSDVSKFMIQAGVFVSTPILEEGFGISVVEAMASGLICVCSKSGALPEIIHDGENGFLVEKDSPGVLADTLRRIITESEHKINVIRMRAINDADGYNILKYTERLDAIIGYIH